MKKISLEQLQKESRTDSYSEQYRYIRGQIEKQKIMPVKKSPLNGKKPALHTSYWLVEEKPDYGEEIEELQFRTVPAIGTDYYLKHLESYREERKWVRLLNHFFLEQDQPGMRELPYVSLNERSFQIWGREKFLQREQGKRILAHCGVDLEKLHVYRTTEPLAYYSCTHRVPQTILILENKDTFYTMRRWLMGEGGVDGMAETLPQKIFGMEIGTVIYGAGKGILRSFEDFQFCVEPHINHSANEILYFGDLDYEGIGIYERLADLFSGSMEEAANAGWAGDKSTGLAPEVLSGCAGESAKPHPDALLAGAGEELPNLTEKRHEIRPFIQAYEKMIEKALKFGTDFLPQMSENQNHKLSGKFFRYFNHQTKQAMERILLENRYIPQEIVTITDY